MFYFQPFETGWRKQRRVVFSVLKQAVGNRDVFYFQPFETGWRKQRRALFSTL